MLLQATKLFYNGNIITLNPAIPRATAVAVFGKMIVGIGSLSDLETLIGPDTKKIDLEGRTMLPGINDSHSHLLHYGLNLMNIDLSPNLCSSVDAMKEILKNVASQTKANKWIQGWSWDETRMKDGRAPTVHDLSEAVPNHPIMLTRACLHMVVVNQVALDLAGITDSTPDPIGGKIVRDQDGKATGLLQDNAQNLVKKLIPPASKEDVMKAIEIASKAYNAEGITSTCDASTLVEIEDEIPAWYESWKNGKLTVRNTTLMGGDVVGKIRSLGLGSNFGDDMLRFGCVKFFMDGSLGGRTSAMVKPFLGGNGDEYGLTYLEQEDLSARVKRAHDEGYQISVHGIGDRALDMILNAFEAALEANPRVNHRHRIEHGSMLRPELLKRVKKAGICVSMNPDFLYSFGIAHRINIGDETKYEFPMKTALEMGIPTAIGSDCPVLIPFPGQGLYGAVARKAVDGQSLGEEERLSIAQAIEAYTKAGAFMTFEENIKGTIEVGKLADFSVWNFDPYKIESPEALLDLHAQMTVLGGEIVYEV